MVTSRNPKRKVMIQPLAEHTVASTPIRDPKAATSSHTVHEKDFFAPMDNQVGVFNTLYHGITDAYRRRVKKVFIVRGGPGTGKSVLALKLLSKLIGGYEDKYDKTHVFIPTLYVTKTQAPRETYSKELEAYSVSPEHTFLIHCTVG